MLLIYDGYCAHLPFLALELLAEAGIIAYGLPAHRSSSTRLLDRCVFSSFKAKFRSLLDKTIAVHMVKGLILNEMDGFLLLLNCAALGEKFLVLGCFPDFIGCVVCMNYCLL